MSDPTAVADLHSHLVPGVDDGAASVAHVTEGVGRMTAAGIRKIIATPHFDASVVEEPPRFEERMDLIDTAWREGSTAVAEAFPEVDFRRGVEIMLDVPDVELADERLRLAGTQFVLVEWPRMQIPPSTVEVVSRLRTKGVRPIIAHPERYFGMDDDLGLAREWKRVGGYLQVNYGSLVGRYGNRIRNVAFGLLRRGWVDYLATDFHGRPDLELYKDEAHRELEDLGAGEQLHTLTVTNPGRVFIDEEPLPVGPLPSERGFWDRVRDIFQMGSA